MLTSNTGTNTIASVLVLHETLCNGTKSAANVTSKLTVLLLSHAASPFARSPSHNTPLSEAKAFRHLAILRCRHAAGSELIELGLSTLHFIIQYQDNTTILYISKGLVDF